MGQSTTGMGPTSLHRWPSLEWAAGGALIGLVVFAHREALAGMVSLWNTSPMYSYGYVVPLIALYLLWTRRALLATLAPAPARTLGSATLAAGLGLSIAGRAGGIQVLEQLAFLLCLVAVVLLVLGVAYLRASWAAMAYLLLMVPIWDGLTESLHAPFQHRSAAIGVAILQGVGIPAYREGTLITLPGISLEVARSCSGVNYLVAVVALGLPMAYLYLPGLWRRVTLIVAAVLVAALANGIRVALIGILAHLEIGSPLHGPFHVLHGLFVSAAGYMVLFAGLRVLTPRSRTGVVQPLPAQAGARRLPRLELVATGLLFAAMGAGVLARQPGAVPLPASLDELPSSLGAWSGERLPVSSRGDTPWPGADAELHRRYRRRDGTAVDLHVAYFAAQRQGKEIASFRTADLHRRATPAAITTTSATSFEVNLVQGPNGRFEALFWYEVGSSVETSAPRAKLRTLWHALVYRRNSGMAVMLTPAGAAVASAADLQELGGLVRSALETHVQQPPRKSVP